MDQGVDASIKKFTESTFKRLMLNILATCDKRTVQVYALFIGSKSDPRYWACMPVLVFWSSHSGDDDTIFMSEKRWPTSPSLLIPAPKSPIAESLSFFPGHIECF
ncbi:endochitinase 1 precursor [Histoplasma ohiense]|nr:endochitinase 1 precursor [Histoplasma ohiense (nom. inval.)]